MLKSYRESNEVSISRTAGNDGSPEHSLRASRVCRGRSDESGIQKDLGVFSGTVAALDRLPRFVSGHHARPFFGVTWHHLVLE